MDDMNKKIEQVAAFRMTKEVRYLTDDRDSENRKELVVMAGGNGDWYVGVCAEGSYPIGNMVRICTSGGVSVRCPGLAAAIASAFRSINSNSTLGRSAVK